MVINAAHQGVGMTSRRTRERLIARLKERGIQDERVLRVMCETPRHLFVEEALASRAYEDTALPIGFGQTISQPFIVARMTEAVLLGASVDNVLEIGTGSGYQAAILGQLVRRVYTIERIQALSDLAKQRFRELKLRNVHARYSDGRIGLADYAPYDAIIVTAAPEQIPVELINQLRDGGHLIVPFGSKSDQQLVRVVRKGSSYSMEKLETVSFVPLLGGTR